MALYLSRLVTLSHGGVMRSGQAGTGSLRTPGLRASRLWLATTFPGHGADVRRRPFGHTELRRDLSGRQLLRDVLDAQLDALLDALLDLLRGRAALLLLLLGLLHLLQLIVGRNDFLAVEPDGLGHGAKDLPAAGDAHDLHVRGVHRSL